LNIFFWLANCDKQVKYKSVCSRVESSLMMNLVSFEQQLLSMKCIALVAFPFSKLPKAKITLSLSEH
jgi:hypothetical protein